MLNNFSISERKVAIIGAGFVGASIAYALTIRKLAREIVLIDIHEEKTIGEALDIQHGIPDMGISSVKAGNYEDCKDCDLIIITAGRNRKPGETRLDLIAGNSAILKNVVDQMKPHYTKGVIMIVSNPVDVLVYQCTKWMGSEWNGFWNRLHSGFLSFYPLNRRLYSSEYRSSKSNHRRRTWRCPDSNLESCFDCRCAYTGIL